MPIDNFEIIKPLLKFDNKQEFYFLQIITRKKDFTEGQVRYGRNNNGLLAPTASRRYSDSGR